MTARPSFRTRLRPAGNTRPAQQYLAKIWSCIRSNLKRQSIAIYGFRIAEPQHDGTPHWHLLLFSAPESIQDLKDIVSKHALKDSPEEAGGTEASLRLQAHRPQQGLCSRPHREVRGQEHRWTSRRLRLEWKASNRYSRTGGRLGRDVGNSTVPADRRAACRRLARAAACARSPTGSVIHLIEAHNAVNKVAGIEGRKNASVAWDQYCRAQGGVFCGRHARIKLAMTTPETVGQNTETLHHSVPTALKRKRLSPSMIPPPLSGQAHVSCTGSSNRPGTNG